MFCRTDRRVREMIEKRRGVEGKAGGEGGIYICKMKIVKLKK